MSEDVVDFNKFKARREQDADHAEKAARAEADKLANDPPFKAFHEIMTPTPISPDNIQFYMKDLLHSLTQRFQTAQSDHPNVKGIFNAHLRLTGHSFYNSAMIETRDSYEAYLKENAPKDHQRIMRKALRDHVGADKGAQQAAIKDAFMDAMIGDSYAYRAVAKQLSESFPGLSWNPALTPIAPRQSVPTIEIHVPEREGHDLIALVERFVYKYEDRNQDGSRKPPPHLKPV